MKISGDTQQVPPAVKFLPSIQWTRQTFEHHGENGIKNTLKVVRKNIEIDAERAPAGTLKKVLFNTVLDIIWIHVQTKCAKLFVLNYGPG